MILRKESVFVWHSSDLAVQHTSGKIFQNPRMFFSRLGFSKEVIALHHFCLIHKKNSPTHTAIFKSSSLSTVSFRESAVTLSVNFTVLTGDIPKITDVNNLKDRKVVAWRAESNNVFPFFCAFTWFKFLSIN